MKSGNLPKLLLIASVILALGAVLIGLPAATEAQRSDQGDIDIQQTSSAETTIAPEFGKLPLSFVPNAGQTNSTVRFEARGMGGRLFFTPGGVVLSLPTPAEPRTLSVEPGDDSDRTLNAHPLPRNTAMLRLRFEGANSTPEITGDERLPGIVNYFTGNDPAKWQTNLPTYAGVVYRELYPGIDLQYDGTEGLLKGTYTVAPGADPSRIRWRYDGATNMRINETTGDLLIDLYTPAAKQERAVDHRLEAKERRRESQSKIQNLKSKIIESAPIAWQEIDGQHVPVSIRYAITDDGSINFTLGDYDSTHPLTLDPTLIYSTYLGGSGTDEGNGVAVDSAGNVYVTGLTYSSNFPTASPLDNTLGGSEDAFVTKLNAAGSALLYSTYLGGSGSDEGADIALDGAGNVYLTGWTNSADFPLAGPLDNTLGGRDAFVTKLNAAGSALLYSTFLGGSSIDGGDGIAVDGGGSAYIVGSTFSSNFPTINALQSTKGGGTTDAFMTKLNAAGNGMLYSTYLGGSGSDEGADVAVDSAGNAYVTGWTTSTNFPTANPLQSANGGGHDVFVSKLNAVGSALLYSTYLGGSNVDTGEGIALNSAGDAYVTGQVRSTDFPTVNPLQSNKGGGLNDGFVMMLNAVGNGIVYSTYLGGSDSDSVYDIAVDSAGNAYVTGFTESTNFPADAIYGTPGADRYAFVTKLNGLGSALLYSNYLGGIGLNEGHGIAVDSANNAYATGWTDSTSFPTLNPAQAILGGSSDAFVAKFEETDPNIDIGFRPNPDGYQFSNYGGVNYADYTTDDMRQMFGDDAVCWIDANSGSCSIKPTAQSWYNDVHKKMNGGHCDGFTTTSLRFFKGLDNPDDFQGGENTTYDLLLSNARRHVAYYWVLQVPNPVATARFNALQKTPSQVLDQLSSAMSGGANDPTTLLVYNSNLTSGHSITPYTIESRGNGVYWVWVYDNNHPNDATRYVEINTTNNTWSYNLGGTTSWSGNANSYSLGAIPISTYAQQPVCPWCFGGSSFGHVGLTGQGHLLITDSQGQRIGYVGSQFVHEISGAFGSVPPGGLDVSKEPIYTLPLTDTYTILLDGQTLTQTETVEVSQFGPGYAVLADDVTLGPTSQDQLTITPDGTQLAYQSSSDKEVTLTLTLDDASESNHLQVNGADIGAWQVVTLRADVDNGQLVFNNAQANGGEYDLAFKRINAAGEQTFAHTGLAISATDTHYLDYDNWDGSGPMMLQIDHGSDGTIDETLQLQAYEIYLPIILKAH